MTSDIKQRYTICVHDDAPPHAREVTHWFSETMARGIAFDYSIHYNCTVSVHEIATDKLLVTFVKGRAK